MSTIVRLKAFPLGSRLLYPPGGIKEYLRVHQRKDVSKMVSEGAELQPVGVAEQ